MGIASRITGREAGFTLIELLVVMLILGILAAVALPTFLNQKNKAGDAKAKELAHTAQVAMEACAVDNGGVYSTTKCKLANLRAIEPTIPSSAKEITVEPEKPSGGYTVSAIANSGSENTFSIVRSETGAVTYTCKVKTTYRGGCPGSAKKNGVWGP
jgi:type IV pilus assembly protein PilA